MGLGLCLQLFRSICDLRYDQGADRLLSRKRDPKAIFDEALRSVDQWDNLHIYWKSR